MLRLQDLLPMRSSLRAYHPCRQMLLKYSRVGVSAGTPQVAWGLPKYNNTFPLSPLFFCAVRCVQLSQPLLAFSFHASIFKEKVMHFSLALPFAS